MNTTPGLPFEPLDQTTRPRNVLTVSELTATIRVVLETTYAETWVEGEVSNVRLWKTGHVYFTLKDASAQLSAVMFRSSVRRQRFTIENGQHVVARGRVSVYEPRGEYQLVCEHLEPHGLGALQLAFDQLRAKLASEGLFDASRKRPLPLLPHKIGIVTSRDGAALHDILNVLRRRHPSAHVVISPTRVQGGAAATEIVRSLQAVAGIAGVDVIIVGRGGGSMEDLWAFNEESVARAIAASPVPVISAVGHETDVTIADFAADLRAATPSAAAELVAAHTQSLQEAIRQFSRRLEMAAALAINRRRTRVHHLDSRPGLAGWATRLANRERHVDDLNHRLQAAMRAVVSRQRQRAHTLQRTLDSLTLERRLSVMRTRLTTLRQRLASTGRRMIDTRTNSFRDAAARLDALSPLAVLQRGYAVCWDSSRTQIIRSAGAVTTGQGVRVTLHDGELVCEVTRTE